MELQERISRFIESAKGLDGLINHLIQPNEGTSFFKDCSSVESGASEFNKSLTIPALEAYEQSREDVTLLINSKELYSDEQDLLKSAIEYTEDLSLILKEMVQDSSTIKLAFSTNEDDESKKIQLIDGLSLLQVPLPDIIKSLEDAFCQSNSISMGR